MDHLLTVEIEAVQRIGTQFASGSDEATIAGESIPCVARDSSLVSDAIAPASEIVRSLATRIAGRLTSLSETASAAGVIYGTTEEATASAFSALGRGL